LTPHIPDKWYVFEVTRSNYRDLIEAGVKIYEYTPGFVHSKTFVVDDKMAIVGTVNMDYRSYYLHYECGVWFCDRRDKTGADLSASALYENIRDES
jgi:cardiolipin synthase